MFYKTGVDISNNRSMYNFLNNHFMYDTLSSWNGLKSIANNVKVYNLNLEGDAWEALAALERDDYFTVNSMIKNWEMLHPDYKVGFNGRSSGYLVLYNANNNCNAIPDRLYGYDSYEAFKEAYLDYYGSMAEAKQDLREYVELVRDFDVLCDRIRDYVNELSKCDLKGEYFAEVIDEFNDIYMEDLDELGYEQLELKNGQVYVGEIFKLKCLKNALLRLFNDDYKVKIKNNFLSLEAN